MRLKVEAYRFSAIVECIWLAEDIAALGSALPALADSDEAIFAIGAGRGLELRLGGEETSIEHGATTFDATLLGPSADALASS